MERTYWAHYKAGRRSHKIGPFASREEAIAAVKRRPHKTGTAMVGYGTSGAWFAIEWPCTMPEPTMARSNDFMRTP